MHAYERAIEKLLNGEPIKSLAPLHQWTCSCKSELADELNIYSEILLLKKQFDAVLASKDEMAILSQFGEFSKKIKTLTGKAVTINTKIGTAQTAHLAQCLAPKAPLPDGRDSDSLPQPSKIKKSEPRPSVSGTISVQINVEEQRKQLEISIEGLATAIEIIPSTQVDFKEEIAQIKYHYALFEKTSDLKQINALNELINKIKDKSPAVRDYLTGYIDLEKASKLPLIVFIESIIPLSPILDEEGKQAIEAHSRFANLKNAYLSGDISTPIGKVHEALSLIERHVLKSNIAKSWRISKSSLHKQERIETLFRSLDQLEILALKLQKKYHADINDVIYEIRRLRDMLAFKKEKARNPLTIEDTQLFEKIVDVYQEQLQQHHRFLKQEKIKKQQQREEFDTNCLVVSNLMSKKYIDSLERLFSWKTSCHQDLKPLFAKYFLLLERKKELDGFLHSQNFHQRLSQLTKEISSIIAEIADKEHLIDSEWERIENEINRFSANKKLILAFLSEIDTLKENELQFIQQLPSSSFVEKMKLFITIIKEYPLLFDLNHESLLALLNDRFIERKQIKTHPALQHILEIFSHQEQNFDVVFKPTGLLQSGSVLERLIQFNHLFDAFHSSPVEIKGIQSTLRDLDKRNEFFKEKLTGDHKKLEPYRLRLEQLTSLAEEIKALKAVEKEEFKSFYQEFTHLAERNSNREKEWARLQKMEIISEDDFNHLWEEFANDEVSIKQLEKNITVIQEKIKTHKQHIEGEQIKISWTLKYNTLSETRKRLVESCNHTINAQHHFVSGKEISSIRQKIQQSMGKLGFIWNNFSFHYEELSRLSGSETYFHKQLNVLTKTEHEVKQIFQQLNALIEEKRKTVETAEIEHKRKIEHIRKDLDALIEMNHRLSRINKNAEVVQFQTNSASESCIAQTVEALQAQLQPGLLLVVEDVNENIFCILNHQETWLNCLIRDFNLLSPKKAAGVLSEDNPFKTEVQKYVEIINRPIPEIKMPPFNTPKLEKIRQKTLSVQHSLSLLEKNLLEFKENRQQLEQYDAYATIFEKTFKHPILVGYNYLLEEITLRYNRCLQSAPNTNLSLDHSDISEFETLHPDLPILIQLYRNLKLSKEEYLIAAKQHIERKGAGDAQQLINQYKNQCSTLMLGIKPQLAKSDTRQWWEKILTRLLKLFRTITQFKNTLFYAEKPSKGSTLSKEAVDVFENLDLRLQRNG